MHLHERLARRVLSLPSGFFVPLAGRRPVIDEQRLTPRMQALVKVGRWMMDGLDDPPKGWQRRIFEMLMRVTAPSDSGEVIRESISLQGADGAPREARLYVPRRLPEESGLAIFVHGGGWQVGSLDGYDGLCAYLAETAEVKVISFDYRLSRQAKFPAAFDDVVAGYLQTIERAGEFGISRERIAIVGDSAGGNIAAAAALHLGATRTVSPALAMLVYPCVDGDLDSYESAYLFDTPLTRETVHRDMRRYVPHEEELGDPRFSVMAATDLVKMPPTYIATAGMDVLRDQGEAFGERLRSEGAAATVRRFPNLPHGFLGLFVDPDARSATEEIALALRAAISSRSRTAPGRPLIRSRHQ